MSPQGARPDPGSLAWWHDLVLSTCLNFTNSGSLKYSFNCPFLPDTYGALPCTHFHELILLLWENWRYCMWTSWSTAFIWVVLNCRGTVNTSSEWELNPGVSGQPAMYAQIKYLSYTITCPCSSAHELVDLTILWESFEHQHEIFPGTVSCILQTTV